MGKPKTGRRALGSPRTGRALRRIAMAIRALGISPLRRALGSPSDAARDGPAEPAGCATLRGDTVESATAYRRRR